MLQLIKVMNLNDFDLKPLVFDSKLEGFTFVQRLIDEYDDGKQTFKGPNELLLVAMNEYGKILAIGGIHPDPYTSEANVGRIRHVFVLSAYRRMGVASSMVKALMEFGVENFDLLTLRVSGDAIAPLYENFGFESSKRENTTHDFTIKR